MKLLSLCVLGFLLIGPFAFSVPPTEAGSVKEVENNRERAIEPTKGYTKTLNNKEYIGGAFASMFLGFGIGHAIQGRWWDEGGWVFTLGEGVTVGVILSSLLLTGGIKGFEARSSKQVTVKNIHSAWGEGLKWGGFISLLLFIPLRIWASIDSWVLPSHIKVAQESRFQIIPLVVSNHSNSNNLSLGLSMKYRF